VRRGFVDELTGLAERNERIVLLTGDVGFAFLERFAARVPRRFINVGVAEQNMVGIAAGLAEGGHLPFVYSIGTFALLRPLEFIRSAAVAQRLPIRIVAVGGGVDYGTAGPTHHLLEDVAFVRALPGLMAVVPADTRQARAALRATWHLPAPVYYRLARDEGPDVPGLGAAFEPGRLDVVRDGRDAALIALGPMAPVCVEASEILRGRGIDATVAVVSCVSPPPVHDLRALLQRHRLAISVESHLVEGGLGSLVAEVIADHGLPCRLIRRGLRPAQATGSRRFLETISGLTAADLAAFVAEP
jgi:transketolase